METKNEIPQTDLLERLGFTRAAERVKELKERKRKLATAYEFYRFVRPEKIDAFNAKLRGEKNWVTGYKMLGFTRIEAYPEVPPLSVLKSLETAHERKCFDTFEVAHIVDVKDPILFGRIEGCPDRFYIDQWDNDVRIEDILADHEG